MNGVVNLYFCHGSKHSKGVAILFNPKLCAEIEQQIQSEDGRILILQVQVDNLKLVCPNIYTPNDTSSQTTFIRRVQNLLQQFPEENIIIGGDFNCPFAKDDKEGGRDLSSKKNVVVEVKLLLSNLD